jgi:hypothetical protein
MEPVWVISAIGILIALVIAWRIHSGGREG